MPMLKTENYLITFYVCGYIDKREIVSLLTGIYWDAFTESRNI